MKEIVIAHLYYDLLNLYGEKGNMIILKKELENQGLKVTLKELTVADKLNFDKYDLVYIGAGTENNQKIALESLMKYKDKIKERVNENKHFLITGNAIEMFGSYILAKNKERHECLNLFHYHTEEREKRMAEEALMKCRFVDKLIFGAQNQPSFIIGNDKPLFEVVKGIGSFPGAKTEGIKYCNFYGTYLFGPLLVRNPHFLEYFIKELVLAKYPNFEFKNFELEDNEKAYDTFMNNFYKNYT